MIHSAETAVSMQHIQWTDVGLLFCCVATMYFRYLESRLTTEKREKLFLKAVASFDHDASVEAKETAVGAAGCEELPAELTDSAKKFLYSLERYGDNTTGQGNSSPSHGESEEWRNITTQGFLHRLSSFYAHYDIAATGQDEQQQVQQQQQQLLDMESPKVVRHRNAFTEPFALLLRLPMEDTLGVSSNLLSVISNCLTFFLRPSQVLYTFLFSNLDFCIYLMEYLLERQQLFDLYVVIQARRGATATVPSVRTHSPPAPTTADITLVQHAHTGSGSGRQEDEHPVAAEGGDRLGTGGNGPRDVDGGENVCPHEGTSMAAPAMTVTVVEVNTTDSKSNNATNTSDDNSNINKNNNNNNNNNNNSIDRLNNREGKKKLNMSLDENAIAAAVEDQHRPSTSQDRTNERTYGPSVLRTFLFRLRHYAAELWRGQTDTAEEMGGALGEDGEAMRAPHSPSNFSFFAKHDYHFQAQLERERSRVRNRRQSVQNHDDSCIHKMNSDGVDCFMGCGGAQRSGWSFILLFLQGPLLLVVLNVLMTGVLVVLHSYHLFFSLGAGAGYLAALLVLFLFGMEISKFLELMGGAPVVQAGLRRWWNSLDGAHALRTLPANSGRLCVALLRKTRDGTRFVVRQWGSEKGRQRLARVSAKFLTHLFSAGCSFLYIIMLFDEGEALYSTHVEFTRWYVATTATALLEVTCCINSVISTSK